MHSKTSKDLFSAHAHEYSCFRPSYPASLFAYLSGLVDESHCAWDCATGNGQAALLLTPYFDCIYATDLSQNQINNATPHKKIIYSVARAEDSHLRPASIDLITVAQAFHWFDQQAFALEVARIAKKKGILAIWCYSLATISPEIDKILRYLYQDILSSFWEPERRLVENIYNSVVLPFALLPSPRFAMGVSWTFEHLIGYLRTWSALKKYRAEQHQDPLAPLQEDLAHAWGAQTSRSLKWELHPKIWRIG